MSEVVSVSAEVADAVQAGHPVVALESSVIAHGFTYPLNLDTAVETATAVRAAGALPARVGIIEGRLVVGMTDAQVERFATEKGIAKVSTRDIGPTIASGELGATTVSASLLAAAHAGIDILSVAGLGGVHFNAQQTFDISADLVQLARHRVAVVCAGSKSNLDPALTLEYLETLGIPVVGYRCDDFPAYYSVSSGQRNPRRVDDLPALARAIRAHWAVGNDGGFLVTHPIAEADALPSEEVYALIHQTLAQARQDGVQGPAVTPYILSAVSTATRGRTAEANRSVLLSTAAVAGEVAVALAAAPGEQRGRRAA
jgi:pseudouridylate synthase